MSETLLLQFNLQFFAQDGEGGEKTEDATDKKLRDARDEGKVAKSQELNSAVMLIALFAILNIAIGFVGNRFLYVFKWAYGIIPDVVSQSGHGITVPTAKYLMQESMLQIIISCLPFFLAGVGVALIINIIQVKWHVSTKAMKPKFDKFNPVNGFKRIFSKESLVNLLKSIIKLVVIFFVAYSYLKNEADNLFILYEIPLNQAVAMVGEIILTVGLRIALVYLVIGLVDYMYQKHKFREDMKMTKQEVKDEYKNTEGDPQIKGQQRQRMREASQRRMMQDVPKADVVITNPTHLSVAIKYDPQSGDAPIVVAKGEDYLALRIREIAKENNVEIMENKPLARALYATVDVGEAIPPELYEAVATVLATIYQKRGRI